MVLAGDSFLVCCAACLHDCLALSDFPTGGGTPGLSDDGLGAVSEAAACMLHHMCTADHNTPSLYQFALPCPHIMSVAGITSN
jgi:hypothetical protein